MAHTTNSFQSTGTHTLGQETDIPLLSTCFYSLTAVDVRILVGFQGLSKTKSQQFYGLATPILFVWFLQVSRDLRFLRFAFRFLFEISMISTISQRFQIGFEVCCFSTVCNHCNLIILRLGYRFQTRLYWIYTIML